MKIKALRSELIHSKIIGAGSKSLFSEKVTNKSSHIETRIYKIKTHVKAARAYTMKDIGECRIRKKIKNIKKW